MNLYSTPFLQPIYDRAIDPAFAHKIAIEHVNGRRLTYEQLVQSADALAVNLQTRGLQPGDRALILFRPSVETLIVVFALIRAGAVIVLGDPTMGKEVFESRMRIAEVKWVFESIFLLLQQWTWLRNLLKQRGMDIPEIRNLGDAQVITIGRFPFLGTPLRTLLHPCPEMPPTVISDEDHDLLIVFTSGTTAEPKGVVHTYRSVTTILNTVTEYLQLDCFDVVHAEALYFALPALRAGARVVLSSVSSSPAKVLDTWHRYQVTRTVAVPARLKAVAAEAVRRKEKLPQTLKTLVLGAAPVFPDFLESIRGVLEPQTHVWIVYGATEILPVCGVSLDEKLAFDHSKGDLVGRTVSGVCAAVTEDNQLVLSGAALFDRYLGCPCVSQYHTGDLALIEDGNIILLGRKKDMIIRGSYNIYPPLYESAVRRIAGVHDCAFVGVYDLAKSDEVIVLFVDTASVAVSAIREQLLTGENSIDTFALPDFIFRAPIVYAGRSQKVDRRELRRIARERLGILKSPHAGVLDTN